MKLFLSFITNWSEPFSYMIYFISLLIYSRQDKTSRIKILIVFYLVSMVLMSIASYNVYNQKSNYWAYNIMFLLASISFFSISTRSYFRRQNALQ